MPGWGKSRVRTPSHPRLQATVEEQLQAPAKDMIEDLEFAMEIDQEEINRLKDRDRKREKLLADKAEAKRLAVEKVRKTEKDKWEAKLNEHEAQLEDKLSHHKKEIASECKNIFEEQRKSVNVAHAEKRAAWKRTAQANRKVKRLAVEVDDLKTVDESESEASEDESMGENSDSQEDSPCQPRKLGFEVRPRRDEHGRWQAEDEDLHA